MKYKKTIIIKIGKKNGKTHEDIRARLLMRILDKSDALLDLHAFRYKNGAPFIICEKDSYDLASRMNFKFITSGWDKFDVGSTDGYMRSLGKQALCLELGPIFQEKKYLPLTMESIMQFLKYYGAVINVNIRYRNRNQIYIKLRKRIIKKSDKFKFTRQYKTCDRLKSLKVFAKDNKKMYKPKNNEYILFPDSSGLIGEETCLIARRLFFNTLGNSRFLF